MEVQVSGRGKTPQQGVTLSRSVLRIAGDGHVEAAAAPRWGLMNNWPESQQVPALERCGFPIAAVRAHGDPAGARRQSGVT